jgi:hypothetical protein
MAIKTINLVSLVNAKNDLPPETLDAYLEKLS